MPAVPSDEEFLAYNEAIISEFRANGGVVNQPPFPILLLTTIGARSGRRATVPVAYGIDDRNRVFVVASKAGAARNPSWFHICGPTRTSWWNSATRPTRPRLS